MYKHLLCFISILFSGNILGVQQEKEDQMLTPNSPSMANVNFTAPYAIQSGEIVMILNKNSNVVGSATASADPSYIFFSIEDAMKELEKKKNQVRKLICKSDFRPESVTLTVPLLSATWSTNSLCKD